MEEKEKQDLEKFKVDKDRIKIQCWDYLVYLERAGEKELLQSGYRKGNADAVISAFRSSQKDIKRLLDEHIKKYPDK